MSGGRHHKSHVNGTRHQMTDEWKDQVRAALRLRGVSEQWLADQIAARRKTKMKRDTINKLLRRYRTSALVPDICAILGLAPPMIATPPAPDDETQRDVQMMLDAPAEIRQAIRLILLGHSKAR